MPARSGNYRSLGVETTVDEVEAKKPKTAPPSRVLGNPDETRLFANGRFPISGA